MLVIGTGAVREPPCIDCFLVSVLVFRLPIRAQTLYNDGPTSALRPARGVLSCHNYILVHIYTRSVNGTMGSVNIRDLYHTGSLYSTVFVICSVT